MVRALGPTGFVVAIATACTSSTGHTPDGGILYTSRPPEVIPCVTDSDCCVVMDTCRAAAYVVHAGDAVQMPPPAGGCVRCVGPSVQVWCKDGTCHSGTLPSLPGPPFSLDHCGALPIPDGGDGTILGEDGGLETMAAYGCEP